MRLLQLLYVLQDEVAEIVKRAACIFSLDFLSHNSTFGGLVKQVWFGLVLFRCTNQYNLLITINPWPLIQTSWPKIEPFHQYPNFHGHIVVLVGHTSTEFFRRKNHPWDKKPSSSSLNCTQSRIPLNCYACNIFQCDTQVSAHFQLMA